MAMAGHALIEFFFLSEIGNIFYQVAFAAQWQLILKHVVRT